MRYLADSIVKVVLLTVFILPTIGSAATDTNPVVRLSEPVEVSDGYETFGEPLPESGEPLSLSAVMQAADDFVDTEVKISMKVDQVCQKKGCFFIGQDGEHLVRVSFKDYEFFVPSNISGRLVTLYGVFEEREMTQKQADHLSEDVGKDAAFAPGPTYEIVAVSVRVPTDS